MMKPNRLEESNVTDSDKSVTAGWNIRWWKNRVEQSNATGWWKTIKKHYRIE